MATSPTESIVPTIPHAVLTEPLCNLRHTARALQQQGRSLCPPDTESETFLCQDTTQGERPMQVGHSQTVAVRLAQELDFS